MGFTGSCNCGSIRFSIDEIEKVLLCTCLAHKRLTGSLLSGLAIVKDSSFFLYSPTTPGIEASAHAEFYRRTIFPSAAPASQDSLVVRPSSSPPPAESFISPPLPAKSPISPPLPPDFLVSARSISPLPEPEADAKSALVVLPPSTGNPSIATPSTPEASEYSPSGDVSASSPLSPPSLKMYTSAPGKLGKNAMQTWFCSDCGSVLWALDCVGEFGLRSILIGTLDAIPSTTTDMWELRAVLQKWSGAEVVVGCSSEKGKEKEEGEGEVKRPLSRSGSGSWTPLEPIPEEEGDEGKKEEPKAPQRAIVRLPGRSHILAVRSKSMSSLE